MILKTDRLILRPWHETDAEDLFRYASDRTIGDACGWPVHTSVEMSLSCIREVFSKPETYAVILKETMLPIGCIALSIPGPVCLENEPGSLELGFWIGREYRGNGLIPEAAGVLIERAFRQLRCTALWCAGYGDNLSSRRVQEKLGFRYHHSEGAVPNARGEYRTVYYSKRMPEDSRNTEQNINDDLLQIINAKTPVAGLTVEMQKYYNIKCENMMLEE